jgi:hypothetical protein
MPADFVRTLLVRLVLFLVFAGALTLTWWSVNRLAPAEKKLQMQSDKLARLEDDVMQLELRWNPREAEQVAGKFKQAQEQVFGGQDEFLRWQEELKRQTNQFFLEVKAQTGRTQACPLPNKVFSVIPATVDMRVSDEAVTQPPYKRLLDFTQNLTTQKKRVDLMELTVIGSSNSVSQAKLAVQLWAQENARTP